MKREVEQLKVLGYPCCPGHDMWPTDTYSSNRSKRARSRDKKKEHKYARTLANRKLMEELNTNEVITQSS